MFFFSSRRRHTRFKCDWSSDVCSSDLAINRFPKDTDADLKRLADYCAEHGAVSAMSEAFTRGGAGAEALAERAVETMEKNPDAKVQPIYSLEDSLEVKVNKGATKIYGHAGVAFTDTANKKLEQFRSWSFGKLPVCIAKTQYS